MSLPEHPPADADALEASLEEARRLDAVAQAKAEQAAAGVPVVPNPAADFVEAYTRSIKRVVRALLLGLSIGVGRAWKASVGSALADAVDEPSGELGQMLAIILQGRLSKTMGLLGFAAAWGEAALKAEVEALHMKAKEPAKRPENVVSINPQPSQNGNVG